MTELIRGVLAGYLAAVVALCAVIVGLLYGLFASRIPAFTTAIARNPVAATRDEPLSILVVAGVFVAIALLVVVIVVFGARYGPTDGNRRARASEENPSGPAEGERQSRPSDSE